MKTITVEFSEEELTAIREYANMCGEFASCLIRKIVIQEITFMKGHRSSDPPVYNYNMMVPEDVSVDEEKKIIEENYNKIRGILGWSKIRIS